MGANLKKKMDWRLCLMASISFGLFDTAAYAESSQPLKKQAAPLIMGVTSFGMQGEQKYIFCDRPECPERSQKNIYVPPPPPPLRMPDPIVATPQAAMPVATVETAPKHIAKKPGKHKKKKKSSPSKKRAVEKMSCPINPK